MKPTNVEAECLERLKTSEPYDKIYEQILFKLQYFCITDKSSVKSLTVSSSHCRLPKLDSPTFADDPL